MGACAAAVLMQPGRCSTAPSRYLLHPKEIYEQVGDVLNVVFPCAALTDASIVRMAIDEGGLRCDLSGLCKMR
jgi:beta-1,4-mannooligosaccharide/beta-1,4-mannosyl-N-acetylglucosamine phosphorylase